MRQLFQYGDNMPNMLHRCLFIIVENEIDELSYSRTNNKVPHFVISQGYPNQRNVSYIKQMSSYTIQGNETIYMKVLDFNPPDTELSRPYICETDNGFEITTSCQCAKGVSVGDVRCFNVHTLKIIFDKDIKLGRGVLIQISISGQYTILIIL